MQTFSSLPMASKSVRTGCVPKTWNGNPLPFYET